MKLPTSKVKACRKSPKNMVIYGPPKIGKTSVLSELDNCLISTSIEQLESTPLIRAKYTHCELHPSMILGHLGFIIPFPNNSQSVRNVYGAGQGKQAVGIYTSNFRNRMDSGVHILNYPQKPLVNTRMSEYIFNSKLPCGVNTIVAEYSDTYPYWRNNTTCDNCGGGDEE